MRHYRREMVMYSFPAWAHLFVGCTLWTRHPYWRLA